MVLENVLNFMVVITKVVMFVFQTGQRLFVVSIVKMVI